MRIIVLSFLLLINISFSQKLTKVEKNILKEVAANTTESIDFLKKVVNINSGTMNHDGVKKVGMIFKEAYDQIGFKTSWIDMSEVNRSGHLFAEINGNKGKKVLLIGHLDTVFEENSPFQEFTMINDSIAHAPGGNDMKGGNIIMLYALKTLFDKGLLKDVQIIVAYTGDEESAGKPLSISRRDLIEAAKKVILL
jgi:glutamate carboxypeptidase